MRVLLKNPTEEACKDFEREVIAHRDYSSDCLDNIDVDYTFTEGSEERVQRWGKQAITQGMVDEVIVLED